MDIFTLIFKNLDKTSSNISDRSLLTSRIREMSELKDFLNSYAQGNGMPADVEVSLNGKDIHASTSELPFILAFMDLFNFYVSSPVRDKNIDPYFVFGSSDYAVSNCPSRVCYVPKLQKAYGYESLAARDLGEEASTSAILKMQHLSVDQLMELIVAGKFQPSLLWSPFEETGFFDAEDYETRQTHNKCYRNLLSFRKETKIVYVKELLRATEHKMRSGDTQSKTICTGIDRMPLMIDPSSIKAILPDSDPWYMISAKIIFAPDMAAKVDLCSFVKEFTGFELPDYHLPINLVQAPIGLDSSKLQDAKKLAETLVEDYLKKTQNS